MSQRGPTHLARYPCGCKTLAPGETSTVEFEMRLPKCDSYQKGARAAKSHEAWWRFYEEHFARQTPEIE